MEIEWNQELVSGIDAIDLQHRHIVSLLNELTTAARSPHNYDLTHHFIEFNKAVQEHFSYEEALLNQCGFRELKRHKAGHEEIRELLDSMTTSIMLEDNAISEDSLNQVVRWFKQHLLSEDTRFFAWQNNS